MRLLFILLLLPFGAYSQFFTDSISVNENGMVTYEEVVEQSGTKEALYTKAKLWIADNFKSAKSVIQTDDKEEGFIVLKGFFKYRYQHYYTSSEKKKKEVVTEVKDLPFNGEAYFTMKIFLKDNKYKTIITDIELEDKVLGYTMDKYTWTGDRITAIKAADLNDLEKRTWQTDQLSKWRVINRDIINTIAGLREYMAKKAENEF